MSLTYRRKRRVCEPIDRTRVAKHVLTVFARPFGVRSSPKFLSTLLLLSALGAGGAIAQTAWGQNMVRTGVVGIANEVEHKLFFSILCMCGCPRETLGTCTCATSHDTREELRSALAAGQTVEQVQAAYVAEWGPGALAVPPNSGGQRALYLVPLMAIVAGGVGVVALMKRWRRQGQESDTAADAGTDPGKPRDAYDDRLDQELRDLD